MKYSIIVLLITGIIVTLIAYADGVNRDPSFPPVNLESGNNTIRLSRIGTYSGDFFDLSSISPPTYDAVSKRIFIPMNDLGRIDTLDISDPANPKKISSIITEQFGGGPNTVDVKNGILAVGLVNPIKTLSGTVVFFDVTGNRIGGPVVVGAQPALLAFTPDGQHVVVANEGEANDEYTIDPKGSISIIDIDSRGEDCHTQHCHLNLQVHTLGFDNYNNKRDELIAAGIRIYGPGASVAQDLEPESVAISPDSQTAWVILQRNNAVAVVDISNNKITAILPLGYKDHNLPGNGFDASDVDSKINIKTWPVRSFYESDIFAPFQVNGTTYLVTANEGDPRDFKGYSELARVSELQLDPAAFPNAASLQSDRQLGRLHVTKVEGDTNNDGYYEQIYMLGSRSFAIWTTDWQLIFDSGDQLEQIAARAVPRFFNTSDDETRFDQKSDERGPEPEELTVGQIGERQYVFVAPERIGGIYVFDITNPNTPVFQQYINYRNFNINPAAVCEKNLPKSDECSQTGDLGPEGILFIAADQSPIGVPLVAITNEVSDSTTLYRIDFRCPSDRDCDGIPDTVEIAQGTNPDIKDNDVFTNPHLFVMQQYRDFLQREGDLGGIDYWTQQLIGSTLDRAGIVDSFLMSLEFGEWVAPIERLYWAYFQRQPDNEELQYWIQQLKQGMPLQAISQAFADSSEFVQLYGELDCNQFIILMYKNVLARDPDPGGLADWSRRLCDGAMTQGEVTLGFVDSPEYQQQRDLAVMLYANLLQRSPDPSGLAYWVEQLQAGMARRALIDGFLNSSEYHQRFLP